MGDGLKILLGDLQYIRSEIQRNEDIGEKRFGFFVTLVTAVSAGMVGLLTSEEAEKFADEAIAMGLVALLGFGLLTYVRLLHRNNVTDDLMGMSDTVRARAVSHCQNPDAEMPPLDWPGKRGIGKFMRAGYAEVVGLIDGALYGALLIYSVDAQIGYAAAGGVILAGMLWLLATIGRGKTSGKGQYFRAGVGAIIRNDAGQVLAFQRTKTSGAWQLPQGGLHAGEDPKKAVLREVKEETGLTEEVLTQVAEFRELLTYELPEKLRSAKTGRGQTQKWFLFELAPGASVDLPANGEFSKSKWMQFDDLAATVIEFRQPVYRRLADWLKQC